MKAAAAMIVDEGINAREVSRRMNIPYTTVGEWGRKYRAGGAEALAAKVVPHGGTKRKASDPRRRAVIAVKQSQPQAGSRRIRDVLKRFFGIGTSETTVRRVLKEEGLAPERAAPRRKPGAKPSPARFERAEPNQLWQSDLFTFLLRRQERLYVAAFMDDHSRYIVSLAMAHHQKSSLVMEALARGIADYGAPREILTDQGRQYTAWRGSTAFEEELKRNGIAHVKSRPHHPQTCGKIERFWKTMWEEFLSRTVFADFDDCQRRAALFVQHYNFQRPHQGLEGLTPADRFFRSAPQVRAAVEATVAENALRLAREQPLRKPFYLVGRLGDRDLAINATAGGVQVRVGDEQTTIPLAKEDDDGQTASAARWNDTRRAKEASLAADAEVAEGPGEAGRGGAQPLHDGALRALGGDPGDGGDRAGAHLARHVLPAGGAGAQGDARGVEPDRDGGEACSAGPLGHPHPDAHGAGAASRAGQAAHEAPAAACAQGEEPGDLGGAPGEEAVACAARLDPQWQDALGALDGDSPAAAGFDPDEGWRGRVLSAERKLAGFDGEADAAPGEEGHGEAEEELHARSVDSAGDGAAHRDHHRSDRGTHDGGAGGALARDVAQPLPDAHASRDGGACRGGDPASGGAPAEAQGDRRARAGEREAAPGERAASRDGRDERALPQGRDRAAAGQDAPGAPGANAQEHERRR
jgi:transposase InsO family protein